MPYVIAGEEASAGIDLYDEHLGTGQAAVLIHRSHSTGSGGVTPGP